MTCSGPDEEVTLELYRQCGGKEKTLLERHCYYNKTKSHDPILHLDTRSGCWKLTPARKDDSCVYKIWCYCDPGYLMSSTDIRVLDPVLISNITSNGSRLGQDIAVSVQYSGEESAVTWEVDGEPLPERYRLIDDNRTLIIPSVQRDDTERTFRVRITNPVSEETRDYNFITDSIFSKLLKKEDTKQVSSSSSGAGECTPSLCITMFGKYNNSELRAVNQEVQSMVRSGEEGAVKTLECMEVIGDGEGHQNVLGGHRLGCPLLMHACPGGAGSSNRKMHLDAMMDESAMLRKVDLSPLDRTTASGITRVVITCTT
ncbi:PREDICTED: uncharacterized protein LOC108801944 [Nanorana parkeri]|uniref:uncharacterized protein LOC108801944 n=1 Tax=Nanorana parkeri TaxID=125878 RepID=UPI000854016A|nr:PREDICTED: uncharacterized protein LOC108801944 [Nanorana parkeri]